MSRVDRSGFDRDRHDGREWIGHAISGSMRWNARDRLRVGFASRCDFKNGFAGFSGGLCERRSVHPCGSCGHCRSCAVGASRQNLLRDVQSWVFAFFRQVGRDASADNLAGIGCSGVPFGSLWVDLDPSVCRSSNGFAGEPRRRGMDCPESKPLSDRAIGRRIEPG